MHQPIILGLYGLDQHNRAILALIDCGDLGASTDYSESQRVKGAMVQITPSNVDLLESPVIVPNPVIIVIIIFCAPEG